MVVSFKIFLDQRRQKQDGTYPLKLRANIDGNLKETALEIAIEAKFWNTNNQRVKPAYPNAQAINLRLSQTLNEYHERVLKLQNRGRHFNLEDLFDQRKSYDKITFQAFAKSEILKLQNAGRTGNALSYQYALNKLDKFVSGRRIAFEEMDFRFLDNFTDYMLGNGMTTNGIAVHMREIRAIYNRALKSDVVELKYYPFGKYKITTEKTINRPLSVVQLQLIVSLELEQGSRLWHCRNYFLLSFCLIGISFVDLINLKAENVAAGRIIYKRRKTKKIYSVKLQEKASALLECYSKQEYLLPMLCAFSGDLTAKKLREKQILKNQNKGQETIGEMCGIDEKLTSYFSRYSWANIAKGLGYSKDMIAEALGHEYGNKVTGIYLDEYGNELIDEMNAKVIAKVFDENRKG